MYRSFGLSGIAVAAVVFAAGSLSGAQENSPSGSYRQTCTDISVKERNLYARCPDKKGRPHSARLSHYQKCVDDIANQDGRLECVHSRSASILPPGSYTATCRNIEMKGGALHALCKAGDGRELASSLKDAHHCAEGVANVNGTLACAATSIIPPGSYLETCRDVRVDGNVLRATCNNGREKWLAAELRDPHKCARDIANHEGKLRCADIRRRK